jgi:peptidoglycan hydrolase-like protein with peptidoglycan-binding domain
LSINKRTNLHEFKTGELPSSSVGLAWIETPQIEPKHVRVNNFGNLTESSTVEVWSKQYWAGVDGTLQYGEPIETKEFSVTDRVYNGFPLYYKSYPRFYHLDLNKYIDGTIYKYNSISVKNKYGNAYAYNYRIVLEVPSIYDTATGSQIAYKIRVETETDDPIIVTYDKCDLDMGNLSNGFSETIYPYPLFTREDSLTKVYPSGIDNYYVEDWAVGDMGYRVHVNSQAIIDERNYQYFQWRVVGKASPYTTAPSSVIITPSATGDPGVFDPTGQVVPEPPSGDPGVIVPRDRVRTFRVCFIKKNSSLSEHHHIINLLRMFLLKDARTPIELINPLAPSGTTPDQNEYWAVTEAQLKALAPSGLRHVFDLIFVFDECGISDYYHWIEEWLTRPGKGLFLILSPGVDVDSRWPFTLNEATGTAMSHRDIIPTTGRLVGQGILPPDFTKFTLRNPFNQNIKTIRNDGVRNFTHALQISVPCAYYNGRDNHGVEDVAAIVDSSIYVSTIGEDRLILGRFTSSGTPATGMSSIGKPNWMVDVDNYGNFNYTKYVTKNVHSVQYKTLDRLVSAVKDLTHSAASEQDSESSTISTTNSDPILDTSIVVEYSTPWVDSWIITADSMTDSEINSDPTLINDLGVLKRRLCSLTISEFATKFFYEKYGQDYKDWIVTDCSIEISNANVLLCEELNDDSIPWVYTNVYGGEPFVEGIGYPNGYRLFEPGFNRPYERDEIQVNSWVRKENEETITNPHGIYVPGEWVDPQKIWHDAITNTTPTTTEEIARKGAWQIGWSNGAAQENISWKASGYTETSGQIQTVSIATQDYISSFTCKSLSEETDKNTAYAWQYLPNGNGILKIGSQGTKVSYWQDLLKQLGYYAGTVDGIYGDMTYSAVYNFQVDHDEILDDGVIGPETASRITFAAGDKAGEWYGWASSWNLLPSRTGKFGRRTNPYDEIYYSDPLTDYVCITLKAKHKVKTLKILGSMLNNQTANITRITAWDGSTRVIDKQDGWTLKNSETSIDLGGTLDIDKIYVHVNQSTPFITVNTDGGSFPGYHWGMDYIDILVSSGSATTKVSNTTDGTVSMYPGDTNTISLPSGSSSAKNVWATFSITAGAASASFTSGSYTASITATGGSVDSTTWGSEESTTVKPSDGIVKIGINPPAIPAGNWESCNLILKTTSNCHSSVSVAFYDIVNGSWKGTSLSKDTYESNISSLKVGVKGGETKTNGGTTTTIPGYWETIEEGYWTESYWIPTSEVRKWTTLEVDGPLSTITSADPPLIKMAIKPYWVRFYNGRRHIRLVPPYLNLSSTDPWYPRITYAEWNQKTRMPSNFLNGWMSYYPGATLTAHYIVPEDSYYEERYRSRVVDEKTEIVGTYEVQLKRNPMFAGATTTGMIDIGLSVDGTGVASTGIFSVDHLGTVLTNVDLTSAQNVLATYSWRKREKEIRGLNLNPYPGNTLTIDSVVTTGQNLIGLPIYVYLLPQYCTYDGAVIIDSIEANTLNWTINKKIFEYGSTVYNPLAFIVGSVALSFPISYDQIIILDARKRGGGDVDSSVEGLWDNSYFSEKTYIEAGVIVIEIPETEHDREVEIRKSIEQYIAAGTLYKIRWV